MAKVIWKGRPLEVSDGQSLLDALLASGESHPNSCRTGACQSCLVRAARAQPPSAWQGGLSGTLKARGFFLACQAVAPDEGLEISTSDELPRFALRVTRVVCPAPGIALVFLNREADFSYEPGQFLQLSREDGLTRSYSLASLPADGHLELHVKLIPGGAMSHHLHTAQPGQILQARGPGGSCFYVSGRAEQPLLLAGTGTGLAPLLGIVRQALGCGHTGPITLIHGSLSVEGLYGLPLLEELAGRYPNFSYVGCVKNADTGLVAAEKSWLQIGDVSDLVVNYTRANAKARFFFCGPPELVNGLRKRVFLAGASMKEILADAFVMAAPPA